MAVSASASAMSASAGSCSAARSNCRFAPSSNPSTSKAPSIASAERDSRVWQRAPEVFQVAQPLGLFGQCGVFAATRRRGLDLGHGGTQFLGLAGALLARGTRAWTPGWPPSSAEGRRGTRAAPLTGTANRSSASRCAPAERSRTWSDWPCTTTRCSPSSASTPTGALRPPTMAHWSVMVRPRISDAVGRRR